MLANYMIVLRVFGVPGNEVTAFLRDLRDDGCPGLRLLERDGEFAICVQASAPTREMGREYCAQWVQKLRAHFGDALYAEGETTLAQAALDALLQKRRLLVAVDEPTGRLLGTPLRALEHSEAAFDFGNETYLNPEKSRKIVIPPSLLEKFPGDLLQAAAGRAQAAMEAAGADLAVAYMPASVGQAAFVLLCDRRGAVAEALPPEANDALIGNCLLDLVRRRVLGLRPGASAITFRPGHERPMLPLPGQDRPKKGDTTRFSLRRRNKDGSRGFEPMLDFDADPLKEGPAPQAAPTGAITFEGAAPAAPRASEPAQPAAAPQAAAKPADGPAVRRTGTFRRVAARTEAPAPASPGAPAQGAAQPTSNAAPPVVPTPAEAAPQPSKPMPAAQPPEAPDRDAPAPSLLDGDIPDFSFPLPQAPAGTDPQPPQDKRRAADRLYGLDVPLPGLDAETLRGRSLAIIEKSERRRRRTVLLVLLLLLLILLGGVLGLWAWLGNRSARPPEPRAYGTASYDEQAAAWLADAQRTQPDVVGYLAFSGQDGALIYTAEAAALALNGPQPAALPAPNGESYLGSAMPGHTVLNWDESLLAFADLETLRKNSGFTVYLPDASYRCRVMAVYYADPAEAGPGAFDPTACGDLSSWYDYLDFVLGVQMRSLFETGVQPGPAGSFVTLIARDPAHGDYLCVTGRVARAAESPQINAASIRAAEQPLLTAVRYADTGQTMPDVAALRADRLQRFAADRTALTEGTQAPQSGSPEDFTQTVDELQQTTQGLLANTDQLIGLLDLYGEQLDAEGPGSGSGGSGGVANGDGAGENGEEVLPDRQVAIPTAQPTAPPTSPPTAPPAPTATPAPTEPGATPEEGGTPPPPTPTQAPTAAPTEAPPPPAGGETINVTMNGQRVTMDLVRCLAMIAQNEMGGAAPAEAYKAQCVAAHCWIMNEGEYPPVAGKEPGAAALAAAWEVAHVLVTYNNSVAFTPYFAAASTGTAASAEVWGGQRAWLQAVESPYDAQYATNWHTNGATSSTARFAAAAVQARVLSKLGIDLTGVDKNRWFTVLSANPYGWVTKVRIGPEDGPNATKTGTYVSGTLLAGQSVNGKSLRSQCFTVTYDETLDCFIFDVYGYGHGCGLSQWGAIGCAKNGWTYDQILTHYYTGTTLVTY